jgi:hypothetical protein
MKASAFPPPRRQLLEHLRERRVRREQDVAPHGLELA